MKIILFHGKYRDERRFQKMLKKSLLVLMLGLLVMNFSSAYTSYNAEFSGSWENGTVLMTDYLHINDGIFYAKNAYPIRAQREKVCETTYTEMKKRVCELQIVGYVDRTKTVCAKVDGKTTCTRQTYPYSIRKNVCHYETYQKPKTTCKYISPGAQIIMCKNPSGVATNALLSENFEYQVYGEDTWNSMPTLDSDWSNSVQNLWIRFRVTIPPVCSPEYDINKAIIINER